MEEAVAFANDAGETLHGILHTPDGAQGSSPIAVVLLSPVTRTRYSPVAAGWNWMNSLRPSGCVVPMASGVVEFVGL